MGSPVLRQIQPYREFPKYFGDLYCWICETGFWLLLSGTLLSSHEKAAARGSEEGPCTPQPRRSETGGLPLPVPVWFLWPALLFPGAWGVVERGREEDAAGRVSQSMGFMSCCVSL